MSDQIILKLGFSLITAIVVPVLAYYIINKLERRNTENLKGKSILSSILTPKEISKLNTYEIEIASSIIADDANLDVSWKDIGGLSNLINDIRQRVIFPFMLFHLFKSKSPLISCPKGVLLHGPPGCGKTTITKAIAKEIGCSIIVPDLSTIMDKWVGESEKLVKALFTLAEKIQPCIIFLDEIDCILRTRNANDHEVTSRLKAIFLTQMDGFLSSKNCRVLLIGATNRLDSVDHAILRRLPQKFFVPLPDAAQRLHILKVILKDIELSTDTDLELIASGTENFSGSDLKELCKSAVALRIFRSNPHLVPPPLTDLDDIAGGSAFHPPILTNKPENSFIDVRLHQTDLLESLARRW